MRLSPFIVANRTAIIDEWQAFASTCTPASSAMDVTGLRDHASEMLLVIAKDLDTAQSRQEQAEKSKGQAPDAPGGHATAAEEHGAGRAASGFSMEQMVSEYRALRASVIRLWTRNQGTLGPEEIEDLTRFNEAIDQALAESVQRYGENLDSSKEMFLAILGHDLRSPLGAIYTSAKFMLDTGDLQEPNRTLVSRVAGSSTRMVRMVGDLLDFTRGRLGGGIPVSREPASLGKIVHEVVDEVCSANPTRKFKVETRGDQQGDWDQARIAQALTNLVGNAVQHGSDTSTVAVDVSGDEREVTIVIHNRGPAIPSDQLVGIFNPMKVRGRTGEPVAGGPTDSLGLGLYIAERIVSAHAGTITVDSTETSGTTFTVRMPRSAPT
jgi:signal transduction histidine kinase